MNVSMKAAVVMAILAGSISVANAAGSGDGEVRFIGSIHEGACSISPQTANQTVDLGAIAKHELVAGGRTNGEPFQIDLEGCDLAGLTNGTVTATFTGTADASIPGALALTGAASNAGIFMEHAGAKVVLGTPTAPQLLQDGSNTLAFNAYVQGHATSDAVPGTFEAVTNFTLAYQ